MGTNGINILVAPAPAYPLAGAVAMCGKENTKPGATSVSVDRLRPWTAESVERALTNGQSAFVKVRKHVLLWSAQERST
jgi:hypothetical protein